MAGRAEGPPVLDQRLDDELGGHAGLHRPRASQAAVQGDAIEHLDVRTVLDHQPFHHIEVVQFPPLRGDLRQMPARWWSGATGASLSVQGSPPFEDAVDGPDRGERVDLTALEGLVDGLRPMGPQIADLSQAGPEG